MWNGICSLAESEKMKKKRTKKKEMRVSARKNNKITDIIRIKVAIFKTHLGTVIRPNEKQKDTMIYTNVERA